MTMRPIDADKLVDMLQGLDKKALRELDLSAAYMSGVVQEIKNRVKDAPTIDWMEGGKTMPEWISVKDRLPDMCGMPCLLYGINQYGQGKVFEGFTGYMELGRVSWHTHCAESENFALNVTHWMPMPEPPKEDT